jgi:hypothetical protein
MGAMFLDRPNDRRKRYRETVKKVCEDRRALLCAVKLALFTKREGFIQSNAQHDVGTFQLIAGSIK